MLELATEFVGSVTLPPGQHLIRGEGDDHWSIEAQTADGLWKFIAGVPGLHAMAADHGILTSDGNPRRLRIRHVQGAASWGLRVLIAQGPDRTFNPLNFDEPGLDISATSFLNSTPPNPALILATSNSVDTPAVNKQHIPARLTWQDSQLFDKAVYAVAHIAFNDATPSKGVILANPLVNNVGHVLASVALHNDLDQDTHNEIWSVAVTDHNLLKQIESGEQPRPHSRRNMSFTYAFVPFDTPSASVARFDSAAETPTKASANFRAERLGVGQYLVHIPNDWDAAVAYVQPMHNRNQTTSVPPIIATWEPNSDTSLSIRLWHADVHDGSAKPADAPFSVALFPVTRSALPLAELLDEFVQTDQPAN